MDPVAVRRIDPGGIRTGAGTSRMKHAPLHWNAEKGTAWRTRIPGSGAANTDSINLTLECEGSAEILLFDLL